MNESMEVRQPLQDQVAELVESYPENEATLVLRALHKLYFDSKLTANIREKGFLLFSGLNFAIESGTPRGVDAAIFKEESNRYYKPKTKRKRK